jgi:hypothetical protein
MRTVSKPSIIPFPGRESFGRRPIAPINGDMTCLVLVRHLSSEKALRVSDNGDAVGAVWVPKALLILDPAAQGRFIVATMSKAFARQKRLDVRFIDPERYLPEERVDLALAEGLAARNRNRMRRPHDPLPYPGRNAFA